MRLARAGLCLTGLAAMTMVASAESDDPPERIFNLGNAAYRNQQFDAAAKAYQQALVSKEASLQQRAFYNLGNAYYRLADPLETADPKRAEENFKQSVASYDSALALDPKDADAAFNKKLAEERLKKLQEQQKQQQQQDQKDQKDPKDQKQDQKQDQQQQQQKQNGQDQQKQQEKQQQQQKQGDQSQDQKQQQQQKQNKPGDQKPQQKPEQKPGEQSPQDGKPREMSDAEAKLLLDALRDEEKQWKQLVPVRKAGERASEKNW